MGFEIVDLEPDHDRSGFSCGRSDVLDAFLRDDAGDHHQRGFARVKVALSDGRIIGYYTLSAAGLEGEQKLHQILQAREKTCPAFHLRMVAICHHQPRNELGPALIRHAMESAVRASEDVGVTCLYLQAACEKLIPYYQSYGFARISRRGTGMYMEIAYARDALNSVPS